MAHNKQYVYAGVTYTSPAAGTTNFALTSDHGNSIPYLSQTHITVKKSTDGGTVWTTLTQTTDYTFNSQGTAIILTTGTADGDQIRINRHTPITAQYVTYSDGSLLTSDQLNESELFSLYCDQELSDGDFTLDKESVGLNSTDDLPEGNTNLYYTDERVLEAVKGQGYITDAGVTKITAGDNITINPSGGTGMVTINGTPAGDKGDPGAKGEAGPPGTPGAKGPLGPEGMDGSKGAVGPKGPRGNVGNPGSAGPKGDEGPKGEGLDWNSIPPEVQKGLKGVPGPEGPKGDIGNLGPAGPPGETGPKGAVGNPGPSVTGPKGDLGPKGIVGPPGEKGPIGEKGTIGEAFEYSDFTQEQLDALKGPVGEKGPLGEKGNLGDAFEYSDFTAAQLEGLKGPQGQKGAVGPKGPLGPAGGPPGPPGSGSDGPPGPPGTPGTNGSNGSPGGLGPPGPPGPPGSGGNPGGSGPPGPPGPGGSPGDNYWNKNGNWVEFPGVVSAGAGTSGGAGGSGLKARGFNCKRGRDQGLDSSWFNISWASSNANLWIDASNLGSIASNSDYRIKKNVVEITSNCSERIKRLRPVEFEYTDFIPDNSDVRLFEASSVRYEGFIAHEVGEVIPSGCEGEKDDPVQIQSLKLSAIMSVTVKALQETLAKVEALESRIEALEGGE